MRKGSTLLVAISLFLLLPGCSDEPPPNQIPQPPPHLRGGGGEGDNSVALFSGPINEDDTVPVPSEKWDRIRTHVERFVTNPVYARTNPFRNKLAEILQPPPTQPPVEVMPTTTDTGDTQPVAPPEQDVHPLQQFALNELKLVMIMHGIAQPEAVFVDPLGQPWIVRTGTPIGNKQGQKIRSIKQYKVYVDEPDSEDDTPIGIAPEILTRTFEGDRDPQVNPAFYAEPLTQMPIKNNK
jgi:Tfp pilus assembly protein PilP